MQDNAPSDPLAPLVDTDKAPATHAAPSGDAPPVKSRPKGGRRSAAEEVDAYLAKHGLVAAPAGGPAPDPAGPPPVAMANPEPFDEAATRAGIEGLVKSASGIAEWTVAGKAEEITGDEGQAKQFGAAAAMPEPTQRLVIESGVAWARKTGTNVGPELGVMAGIGQWAVQLRGVVADLREIAAMRRGESGKPEGRKEPLPHAST